MIQQQWQIYLNCYQRMEILSLKSALIDSDSEGSNPPIPALCATLNQTKPKSAEEKAFKFGPFSKSSTSNMVRKEPNPKQNKHEKVFTISL